jgi:hypothetical protein
MLQLFQGGEVPQTREPAVHQTQNLQIVQFFESLLQLGSQLLDPDIVDFETSDLRLPVPCFLDDLPHFPHSDFLRWVGFMAVHGCPSSPPLPLRRVFINLQKMLFFLLFPALCLSIGTLPLASFGQIFFWILPEKEVEAASCWVAMSGEVFLGQIASVVL